MASPRGVEAISRLIGTHGELHRQLTVPAHYTLYYFHCQADLVRPRNKNRESRFPGQALRSAGLDIAFRIAPFSAFHQLTLNDLMAS